MRRAALERRAWNVVRLRELARRRLPRMLFDFVDGGAEDEVTLAANEAAFAEIGFLPAALAGTVSRDQSVELFGERLALPVLVGPTGLSGALWPAGEIAAARAARAAGTVYVVSHGSTCSYESVMAEAGGNLWAQTYIYRDRGVTRTMAQRAEAAGFRALMVTVDNPVLGQRERDLRNGFRVPPRPGWRDGVDLVRCLPWLLRMARHGRLTLGNYAGGEQRVLPLAARIADMLDPTATWDDLTQLREVWAGPLVVKGTLHPGEARGAVARGVDAIVVTNHGGRQLDGAVASIRALPAVVEAVDGRIPVLVDGGIRRGSDVVKALALGATACLIARPHLWGLAVAGEEGVAWVLEMFRRDIDRGLALLGRDGVATLDRTAIVMPRD